MPACAVRLLSHLPWLVLQAEVGAEGACRRLSLESNSSTLDGGSKAIMRTLSDADSTLQPASSAEQPEQQQAQDGDDQQVSDWPQDDDMVVIQDWDDSSLAQYDALDVAAAAGGDGLAAGAADTTPAEEQDGGLQQHQQEMPAAATNHGEWLCHCCHIMTGGKLMCAQAALESSGYAPGECWHNCRPAQPAICMLDLVSAVCLQVTSVLHVPCSRSTSATYPAQALIQGRSTQPCVCAQTSSGRACQQCEFTAMLFSAVLASIVNMQGAGQVKHNQSTAQPTFLCLC
jgi:hypothetical protein